jgi:hypothetical protein
MGKVCPDTYNGERARCGDCRCTRLVVLEVRLACARLITVKRQGKGDADSWRAVALRSPGPEVGPRRYRVDKESSCSLSCSKGPEKSGGQLHDALGSLGRALRSLEALQRTASRRGGLELPRYR